jgi:hypothetical protein
MTMPAPTLPPGSWVRHIGTKTPARLARHALAVAGIGEALLVGRHEGVLDLRPCGSSVVGGPPGQLFVAALGAGGELRWHHTMAVGAPKERWPWTVAADRAGGWYLAGRADERPTVLSLSRFGERVWGRPLPYAVSQAHDGEPLCLAATPDQHLLVYGHGSPEMTGRSPSSAYVFVMKLATSSGAPVWTRRFECAVGTDARRPRVAVDGSGEILLSGYLKGKMLVGPTTLASPKRLDGYVIKLDAQGAPRWAHQIDTRDATDVACGMDATGRVVVAGVFEREPTGTRGLGVRGFAPDGQQRWERFYPASPDAALEVDVAVAEDGGVLVGGTVKGILDLGQRLVSGERHRPSVFVARLSPEGDLAWCRALHGFREVVGMTVHAAPDGAAILAGSFQSSGDFGASVGQSDSGDLDLFVARVAGRGGEPRAAAPEGDAR